MEYLFAYLIGLFSTMFVNMVAWGYGAKWFYSFVDDDDEARTVFVFGVFWPFILMFGIMILPFYLGRGLKYVIKTRKEIK